MTQLIAGAVLIAVAAVLGFYGTQLASEGWTKVFTPASTSESAATNSRPWVAVVVARLLDPLSEGMQPRIQLTCHNSGKTPAVDTRIVGRVAIGAELPEADGLGRPISGQPSSLVLVADGNADGVVQASWTMTSERLVALTEGSASLYAVGSITYCDTAGKSYATRFCFFINGRALETGLLGACATGNTIE